MIHPVGCVNVGRFRWHLIATNRNVQLIDVMCQQVHNRNVYKVHRAELRLTCGLTSFWKNFFFIEQLEI